MSTCASASRLRPSRPAPITSATASAISVTTNALRAQPPRTPRADPLPPWRRPSARSTRDTCHAGARPKIRLAASEIASANINAVRSTVTSVEARQIVRRQREQRADAPARDDHAAGAGQQCEHDALGQHLPDQPHAARRRPRRAPPARGRAPSRAPAAGSRRSRTRSTARTPPPPAARTASGACRRRRCPARGTTAMPLSPLLTGYCCASRDAMPVISDCACVTETPGASRPTPR